ncbi:MAG TPA: L-rhamnose catabolism isomerase [Candidatus Binatus sp.]|uniref:L-rhamnose catabolism isomerase n=1 Tax=Candidatus Binatus sp. TaxID=2811406 RepID=UPI002B46F4C1|nr:L-rhamnose catabolism isomerase [Candidatus Binatus sp.]HKN14256.1 L-rhamnose catabolism isomerase [Candidatus Binatus sp.]
MTLRTPIDPELIAKHNARLENDLAADYEHLGAVLARRGVDLEAITARIQRFAVAIPSWGVGSGGTRFARFPVAGEPRNIFEKLEDCAVIQQLGRATPSVSPHFPWDRVDDLRELRDFARSYGIVFDAINSNTFEDLPGQLSYKFGSLTHTHKPVREQAIAHNLECIEIGKRLGSRALTVWIGDGSNFPGQLNMTKALERYLESMRVIVAALPDGWRAFIEHKLYEPALYSTVIADWGTSFICATQLGANVQCLVDLGHHAPTTNIEQIVARLIQFQRLGGFHFNDSKYGDDDLDTGSVNPFQIFLVFNELVDAELRGAPGFAPAYMLDQSHNVTDPIESLLESAVALQRAYAQALIVDRDALNSAQEKNDALMANRTLQNAVRMDVESAIKMARKRNGGAIDPVAVFRDSRYRQCKVSARPQDMTGKSGIV